MKDNETITFWTIYVHIEKNCENKLYHDINTLLQETFQHSNINGEIIKNTSVATGLHVQEIIFGADYCSIPDTILIISDTSETKNVIEALEEIKYIEYKTVKVFAQIPALLKPNISQDRKLYTSTYGEKLIFYFPNKSDILKDLNTFKEAMVLVSYLLQHTIVEIKTFGDADKRKVEEIPDKHHKQLCPPHSFSSSNLTSHENMNINESNTNTPEIQQICIPKISVEEALTIINKIVCENINESDTEEVEVEKAFGRILCRTAFSCVSVPTSQTATKRGYAVLANSKIKKKIAQNKPNEIVFPPAVFHHDTCTWVEKGSPVPYGATAVVPIEYTKSDYRKRIKIMLNTIEYGLNIKPPGDDIKSDQKIIDAFTRIGAIEMGLLVACRCQSVRVFKELSIGVLSIGDKLQEPGQPLKPGYSYDSNLAILISLLKDNNFNYLDFGIINNDPEFIRDKIKVALEEVNLLVTTGSTNKQEWMTTVLKKDFKATIHFENVNIKPGKSTAFATCTFQDKTKYILCLPANPASVLVTAHLFFLPLVNWMHSNYVLPSIVMAQIQQKLLLHARPRYVWATLSWSKQDKFAKATCKEKTVIKHALSDSEDANALLILPAKTPETEKLNAPSFVPAMLIKLPTKSYIENMFD